MRPHFSLSTEALRELSGADPDGVAAELSYRKSRAARKLARELGAVAGSARARAKAPAVDPEPAGPAEPRALAPYRVLKLREVRGRGTHSCDACGANLVDGEIQWSATVTGPDGFGSHRWCYAPSASGSTCIPQWILDGGESATTAAEPVLDPPVCDACLGLGCGDCAQSGLNDPTPF